MTLIRPCLFCSSLLPFTAPVPDPVIQERFSTCDEACLTAHRTGLAEKLRWYVPWLIA